MQCSTPRHYTFTRRGEYSHAMPSSYEPRFQGSESNLPLPKLAAYHRQSLLLVLYIVAYTHRISYFGRRDSASIQQHFEHRKKQKTPPFFLCFSVYLRCFGKRLSTPTRAVDLLSGAEKKSQLLFFPTRFLLFFFELNVFMDNECYVAWEGNRGSFSKYTFVSFVVVVVVVVDLQHWLSRP